MRLQVRRCRKAEMGGQADETIDGRMAGWLNGWMVVVLFCVWMLWLVGWLCDGLGCLLTIPSRAPWASAVGQQDHGRVAADSLLLGCWRNKNDEQERAHDQRLGRGSAWQFRPAWLIRSQILIQENVGPMLEKSQEHPESYHKVGPQELAGCGLWDGLRVACCVWCCVVKATGT